MLNHRWINQQYNFDHLGQVLDEPILKIVVIDFHPKALLTLFILSTRDAWVKVMYNGIDAVDIDIQPRRNYSQSKMTYFVLFILIVSCFVLSMFVGVVIKNFQNCQAQQELEEEKKIKEKLAKKIQHRRELIIQRVSHYETFSPCRKYLYDICTNKYFDLSISLLIGINLLIMSLECDPMSYVS